MRRERKQGAATSLVVATAVLALVLMASGAYAATSRVFVTSMTYTGDLKTEGFGLPGCGGGACPDGLAGGDAICNVRAAAAMPPLGGTWVAWLSTSTVDAKDRLVPGSGPFVRASGAPAVPHIAPDIPGLTSGTLLDSILNDENGFAQLSLEDVWTGTISAGVVSVSLTCSDWETSNGFVLGAEGRSASSTAVWTQSIQDACDARSRLYCFELPPLAPPASVPAASPAGLAVSMLLALTGLAYLYRRQQAG